MGNPRHWTREFNARNEELNSFLKANKVTKPKRAPLIERAAAGRPADLAVQARRALADRRVQRNLDIIAGRAS